jgi:hypothetical protein
MKSFSVFGGLTALTLALTLATTPVAAQSKRTVQPFDEVVLTGRIIAELVPGDVNEVEILQSETPEDKINISMSGQSLRISTLNRIAKDEEVRLRITYQKLRAIKAQAGVALRHEGPIEADKLEVRIGSGAQAELEVTTDALEVYVGEGGQLMLSGNTNSQQVTASSGGNCDASNLAAKRTYARASAGGMAKVNATEFLDATANTGGQVSYRGEPAEKYTRSSLGGEISSF